MLTLIFDVDGTIAETEEIHRRACDGSDFGEPDVPSTHLAGAGKGERMVSLDAIHSWVSRSAQ